MQASVTLGALLGKIRVAAMAAVVCIGSALAACGGESSADRQEAAEDAVQVTAEHQPQDSSLKADTINGASLPTVGDSALAVRVGSSCNAFYEQIRSLKRMELEVVPDRPGLREGVEALPGKHAAFCTCVGQQMAAFTEEGQMKYAEGYEQGLLDMQTALNQGYLDQFENKLAGLMSVQGFGYQQIRNYVDYTPGADHEAKTALNAACKL